MPNTDTPGTRIRDRRKQLGVGQEELAKGVGVGRPTLSLWENDHSVPRGHHLVALARELDTTEGWVMSGPSVDQDAKVLADADRFRRIAAIVDETRAATDRATWADQLGKLLIRAAGSIPTSDERIRCLKPIIDEAEAEGLASYELWNYFTALRRAVAQEAVDRAATEVEDDRAAAEVARVAAPPPGSGRPAKPASGGR